MIRTDYGPMLAHNCQYGMGAPKFQIYVASGPMGMEPRYLTLPDSYNTINTYRANHPNLTATWRWLNDVAIPFMAGDSMTPLTRGPMTFERHRAIFPNGLALSYPELRPSEDGWAFGYTADMRLYGPLCLENLIQGLSGLLIKEQMIEIDERLDGDTFTRIYQRPQIENRSPQLLADVHEQLANKAAVVHAVHDEVLVACRARDADGVMAEMKAVMEKSPDWAPDLPLKVEGGYDQSYSK